MLLHLSIADPMIKQPQARNYVYGHAVRDGFLLAAVVGCRSERANELAVDRVSQAKQRRHRSRWRASARAAASITSPTAGGADDGRSSFGFRREKEREERSEEGRDDGAAIVWRDRARGVAVRASVRRGRFLGTVSVVREWLCSGRRRWRQQRRRPRR